MDILYLLDNYYYATMTSVVSYQIQVVPKFQAAWKSLQQLSWHDFLMSQEQTTCISHDSEHERHWPQA